ncbi:MAG: hypothetical protein PHP22_06570 [Oscillospiraceae bacterium]|jgi:hypothetical protein|nr:hypothetical protein [Oscillospiraceae bacterium]
MKKQVVNAYCFEVECPECNGKKKIYYTLPDFGDPPIILKCRECGELYWYTPEDDAYIRPIHDQLAGKKCVSCGAVLQESLCPTHKNIKCCSQVVSLDDDFYLSDPQKSMMEEVNVNLIYS